MKVISILALVSAGSVVAFAAAVALSLNALAVFALTASVLMLLVSARDYAPRRSVPAMAPAFVSPRERMPLAA